MGTKEIQGSITQITEDIQVLVYDLDNARKELAHAQTRLVEAIAAESKKPELVNGDYGKFSISKWVFVDGKVNWEDSGIDKNHFEGILTDSRKGNIFREMEEQQE